MFGICMIVSGLEANKDPLLCLQTKIMGLYSYIVSHCIVLYDVYITIWPLDRSIIAEFKKGVIHDEVNCQHPL